MPNLIYRKQQLKGHSTMMSLLITQIAFKVCLEDDRQWLRQG